MGEKRAQDRIVWYLRKADQYGAARFDYFRGKSARQPPWDRFERLVAYKRRLNEVCRREVTTYE